MATVNCSTTSYNRETKDLRSNLLKQRDFDMRKFYADGMTQCDIAACVGVDQATVARLLGDAFEPLVEMHQEDGGYAFEPLVEMHKEDGSEEFEPMVETPQEDGSNVVQEFEPMVEIHKEVKVGNLNHWSKFPKKMGVSSLNHWSKLLKKMEL
jgi:hypothetical protein